MIDPARHVPVVSTAWDATEAQKAIAGVAILDTIVLRMRWPEACLVQPGACVLDDVVGRIERGGRSETR